MSTAIEPGNYRCKAVPTSAAWIEAGAAEALSVELVIPTFERDVASRQAA
jgi:hypothetical protein